MQRSLNTLKGPGDYPTPWELDTTDGTEHEVECECGWIGDRSELKTRPSDNEDVKDPECCPKCKGDVFPNEYHRRPRHDFL